MKNSKKAIMALASALVVFSSVVAVSCSAAVVTDGGAFYPLGDTNKDAKVNLKDLLRCKKYIAESTVDDFFTNGGDTDSDKEITDGDLVAIAKGILNKGVVTVVDSNWSDEIK